MNFKKRLKELRKEKNCTSKDLGKHLNFGGSAISNYESGRNEPSIDTLIKIAEYFDVSIDYLVGRTHIRGNNTDINNYILNILSDFEKDELIKIITILKYIKKTDNK